MKNPITDTHLGIDSNADRFAEVRQRAKEEYTWRKTKKNKQEKVPKYKVGEHIVITKYYRNSNNIFHLIEIIDFEISKWGHEEYYGIVLKSTVKDYDRIGRISSFAYNGNYVFGLCPANVPEESIKWKK